MEKNSKITTTNDNVQQPEDEVNRAPQLNDDEEVSCDDEEEAIFRPSSHKEPIPDDEQNVQRQHEQMAKFENKLKKREQKALRKEQKRQRQQNQRSSN